MPRGIYNRGKQKNKTVTNSSITKTVSLPVLEDDMTNLVLQNGDREMIKSLLESELAVANKKKVKIEKLLAQLPV